jgi:3D (Asp-Asp-Asp) domain-containing protein
VATTANWISDAWRRNWQKVTAQVLAGSALCAITAASAILVKEFGAGVHPLAAVEVVRLPRPAEASAPARTVLGAPETSPESETADAVVPQDLMQYASDATVRWFNGRPVRPARQMWMTVTGYSPDERSCGDSADGLTATLHSVSTNNMKLVAADTSVLPFGSMLSVPGYDETKVVPVLDRGGAIKGRRLDLLFPTHEEARQWGVKRLLVTVWEYADGKPADNPRMLR